MNKKHIKVVGAILIVTLIIGGGLWWLLTIPGFISPAVRGHYYYDIYVNTDIDLYNVTIYVPVPLLNKKVFPIVTENDYSVVDTEHGKMLKITKDIIANSSVYEDTEIKLMMSTDHEINTKNPKGNEPLLCPRFNETFNGTFKSGAPESERYCDYYDYQSYVYIEYDVSNTSYNGSIGIHIRLKGFCMYGALMTGWARSYEDNISFGLDSKYGNGWYIGNGTLSVER